MKEDYLWNKTGSDPEIEKLENALKAFRLKETAPPEIPAKITVVDNKPPRRIFTFAFAFAASLTFVFILVGVWFQLNVENQRAEIDKEKQQTVTDFAKISPQKELTEKPIIKEQNALEENQVDLPIAKTEMTEETVTKRPENSRKTFQKIIYRKKKSNPRIKPKNIKSETETVKLTKEEKYAYDQLMLALSITSSKLKLVRDKVQTSEDSEIILKKEDKIRRN